MERSPRDPRAGLMLVELLVTLVILGLVGAAITGLFLTQSQLFGSQSAQREARAASRSAVNVMLSELRMVDAYGGVDNAEEKSVTIRVPYALGIVCSANAAGITISFLPTDRDLISTASTLAGYAWRNQSGVYQYRLASLGASGAVGSCASSGIAVVPDGQAIQLQPGDPLAHNGASAILFRLVTYDFRPASNPSGSVELWRKVEGTSIEEPIGGPFDPETSGFRYYLFDKAEPEESPPMTPVGIRGIEVVLDGVSRAPDTPGARFATAVFFHNR